MTTVFVIGGAAFLLSMTCWAVGSALVSSRHPLVAMLGGWCCFLLLCAIAWIAGLPAQAMRPFFWVFLAAGIVLSLRRKLWPELACALVSTAIVSALICAPFYLYREVLAYGAHGTDMWGYVITAEWLTRHSVRDLPDIGNVPMRFTWTWHVLITQERPLVYESLSCLASASGLTVVQAYHAYPVALLSSIAMALGREPRLFRWKHWILAVLAAVVAAFHPLIVLPWIAGFFGGAIVAPCVALALAAVVVAEKGPARTEALLLGFLMLVFCAGLYTVKFLLAGELLLLIPVLLAGFAIFFRQGLRGLWDARPDGFAAAVCAVALVAAVSTVRSAKDSQFGPSPAQQPGRIAGHFLGLFGDASPYSWLGYREFRPVDFDFWRNPLGIAALAGMTVLLGSVSWRRWRASRDVTVPLVVGICLGCVWRTTGDELLMAKALPVFGFPLLVVLAAVSGELRHWAAGLAAAAICCLPALRSASEMYEMIHDPYILCTQENVAEVAEVNPWITLAYLHFKEDTAGYDWTRHPEMFTSVTHFLTLADRRKLARKYHFPDPVDENSAAPPEPLAKTAAAPTASGVTPRPPPAP